MDYSTEKRSLALSFLIHVLGVILCFILLQKTKHDRTSDLIWVEVSPSREDLEKSKRIVQTIKTQKSDISPKNAYLGEQNQVVDHETVSLNHKILSAHQKQTEKTLAKKTQKTIELNRFGLELLPKNNLENAKREVVQERIGEEWNQNDIPHDYIKGMKESDRTALNTKEYMFYGYFQRIRERLDLAWGGALREKLFKLYRNGRQLASEMDHITRLVVTLDKGGEIIRVQVLEESGVRDLDEAAVKAFNQAGPFPNPPSGIIDQTGMIQIRWDFILKT